MVEIEKIFNNDSLEGLVTRLDRVTALFKSKESKKTNSCKYHTYWYLVTQSQN